MRFKIRYNSYKKNKDNEIVFIKKQKFLESKISSLPIEGTHHTFKVTNEVLKESILRYIFAYPRDEEKFIKVFR